MVIKIMAFLLSFLIGTAFANGASVGMYDYIEPKENEVFIGHSCIEMPLERILLIHKDSFGPVAEPNLNSQPEGLQAILP